jgi:hypothetical protein
VRDPPWAKRYDERSTAMQLHGEHPAETTIQRLGAPAVIVGKLFALAIVLALFSTYCTQAAEHHGRHGDGHDMWHAEFYSQLMRPDTKTSCCNLADCRPTEIRASNDHYEVKKDGRWIRVATEKVVRTVAPDGGAHICAPPTESTAWDPDYVFCIVMPLET